MVRIVATLAWPKTHTYRFTWCMNAGIIAILFHQLPYQFDGLPVLSTIAYMVEFVLFIIFSLLLLTRLALYRPQAYFEITSNVGDLSLGACWAIAWLTLSSLTCLVVSTSYWGGHSFTIVGYVMWWIGLAWMMAYLLFAVITLARRTHVADREILPLILIPTVGVATVATTGGLISSYASGISARMAVPMIIMSFFMAGIALFTSIPLYAILLHRFLTVGWVPVPMSATMFVLVGPMGQTSTALQILGSAAYTSNHFAGYNKGTFLTEAAAPALSTACVLLALLITGMGCMWAFVALYVMIERAYRRELKWTPAWNSIIFPTGTLATSFLEFSIEMDSPAFRTVTAGLLIILVIMFFVNLGFTIFEIARGRQLMVKEDPRVPKESAKENGKQV